MITRLQIINEMVVSTGTAPLTSSDVLHPLYIKANNKLEVVNETIQGKGWWFNTSQRTMNPIVDGEIILPGNTLHADPVSRASNLSMRGSKLYDMKNATYIIGKAVKVNFIEKLALEELPPLAANYLRAQSVYEFYSDEDGNEPKMSRYDKARMEAWVAFKGEHLKNADVNFFAGTSAAQMSRGAARRGLPLYDEE